MEFLKMICLMLAINTSLLQAQVNKTIKAFEDSYKYEVQKDYKTAAEKIKAVYDEKSYEINARLGWLCYKSGAYNESVNYYNKASTLMPYAFEPQFGLAFPLAELGKWKEVKDIYKKILEKDPYNTIASYRLGMVLYNIKDYVWADKCFQKVVNLYPFDYSSLLMLAWCRYFEQNYNDARLLFNKVLMISPNDKSALEGLGLIK